MYHRICIALAAALAIGSSADAEGEMRAVLARDLSWVRVVPASSPVAEFINLERAKKLQMTDGLAVWHGSLNSALTVKGGYLVGFATHERMEKFVADSVNVSVRDTWNRVLLDRTDVLFFLTLAVLDGKKEGIAIPVNFLEPSADEPTPADQHTGGYFQIPTPTDRSGFIPWQTWKKEAGEEPTSNPYHPYHPPARS